MTQDEAKAIAAVIERLTDNARQRIEQAEQSARADAVTRAEADRVRIEALSEDLRKEREAHAETAESLAFRLETERLQMGKDAERVVKERDALRTEVTKLHALLKNEKQEGDKLWCEVHELRKLKPQTPKQHPVAVGEWVRRTTAGSVAPIGKVGLVLVVWSDAYEVQIRKGFSTLWSFDDCAPCDPTTEANHDTPEGRSVAEAVVRDDRKTDPKPGDTVRLVRVPTPAPDLDGFIDFPWDAQWGASGDVAEVIKTLNPPRLPAVAVRLASELVVWWPLSCVEVVRTEPDEIKVGDVVEVFQKSGAFTISSDVGKQGEVLKINREREGVVTVTLRQYDHDCFDLRDVRKVTT